jgi:phosphoribosyl 1,2-cyclic phosphate phosphodiesterase
VKITFLGTGTSQGVPVIGCQCEVCTSVDSKDQRLRSSIMVSTENVQLVVDTGPDFRQQMLRTGVRHLDAVLYTHAHKDHIAGLDDIRAFNFLQKRPMDVYATLEVQDSLKREFSYIFSDFKYPGIPEINLHTLENRSFEILGEKIVPVEVMHYRLRVFGFRFKDFVYITDANKIDSTEFEKIKGCDTLVLNALRKETHISHFTLEEAIEVANRVGARNTFFTHISHQLGLHEVVNKELPSGMFLAFDGMELDFR